MHPTMQALIPKPLPLVDDLLPSLRVWGRIFDVESLELRKYGNPMNSKLMWALGLRA